MKPYFIILLSFLSFHNFSYCQCVKKISAGAWHSLFIKSNGTLWGCGGNSSGELGQGNNTFSYNVLMPIGLDSNWKEIATGDAHSYALKANGTLWSWGNNSDGQLGNGTTISQNIPIQVGTDSNWKSLSVSGTLFTFGSAAIKNDSTIWVWGVYNNSSIPLQIGNDTDWIMVAGGGGSSTNVLAIKSNGTLWKMNTDTSFIQIGTDTNWKSISNGISHSLALKTNGTFWAWGSNGDGQLGNGGTTSSLFVPTQVGTSMNWVKISAGESTTFAINTSGELWGCGQNHFAQIGLGTLTDTSILTLIANDIKEVDGGDNSTLAIKTDGTYWGWGHNAQGALGDGTNVNKILPTQVTFIICTELPTSSSLEYGDENKFTAYPNPTQNKLFLRN